MKSLLATVPDKVEREGQDRQLRALVKDGGFWTTRWPPTYKQTTFASSIFSLQHGRATLQAANL